MQPVERMRERASIAVGDSARFRRGYRGVGSLSRTLDWLVRVSTAVFGLAVAVAIAPNLLLEARPEDMVSALKVAGYRPASAVLPLVAVVLLSAAAAILGTRVARTLAPYRWAAVSYSVAMFLAPIMLMYYGNLRHLVLLALAAAVIVAVRERDPAFTTGDVVLIPVVLSCLIAFHELGFGRTNAATFLRALLVVFFLRVIVRVPDAWTVAPLALLAQIGWLPGKASAIVALVVIVVGPVIAARLGRGLSRAIVYPIAVVAYPLAILATAPPPTVNLFEESHSIAVAAEMVRGERPYQDVLPQHGLITDGLVDFLSMELGVTSIRRLLEVRILAGVTTALAIYLLLFAATGSRNLSLLATNISYCLASGVMIWLRPSAALFALAAAIAGTRLRKKKWFIAAGALLVLAFLVSVDFAVFSALVITVAAFRARALLPLVKGMTVALVPMLLVFAAFGFADDFLRLLVTSHAMYYTGPRELPHGLRSPAFVHTLPGAFPELLWVVALITTCAALARSPLRARRSDAPWILGMWMVVSAASWVVRGNNSTYAVVVPFLAAALWSIRRAARSVAITLAVIVILLAEPFRHVMSIVPELRRAPTPPVFEPVVEEGIGTARKFVATLAPGETFADFTNSALLYWIFQRDLPIRYVEVANYQSVEAQREVIARIEQNPNVAAALIAFPGSLTAIDGVPNSERAPLVWAYLQENFTPAFDENGVVFLRRKR